MGFHIYGSSCSCSSHWDHKDIFHCFFKQYHLALALSQSAACHYSMKWKSELTDLVTNRNELYRSLYWWACVGLQAAGHLSAVALIQALPVQVTASRPKATVLATDRDTQHFQWFNSVARTQVAVYVSAFIMINYYVNLNYQCITPDTSAIRK
jgi:hypothetical protein